MIEMDHKWLRERDHEIKIELIRVAAAAVGSGLAYDDSHIKHILRAIKGVLNEENPCNRRGSDQDSER